ncbi:uncharacterized protein FIBRA_08379 [Fibroporia radiculosa]|uniref:Sister chromatid cohesion protein n=1 Tax=Fibroporia radiculosa TaxID=599839 RepID=J4GWP1_9APHY|nr:uncharacterized protein FIBRA_08379 [Fibroporia radiculosa]CCM06130.1 predicted protein [Fibroporia radiculosa]
MTKIAALKGISRPHKHSSSRQRRTNRRDHTWADVSDDDLSVKRSRKAQIKGPKGPKTFSPLPVGSGSWTKVKPSTAGNVVTSILEQRNSLPIASGKDAIVNEIKSNNVTILIGETGSGKTTQVPQYLLESGISGQGIIAVTQPRKVAATSLAARVAAEQRVPVGGLVGYSVRFNEAHSPQTRIKYVTDGMLVREMLGDPFLTKYSVIIIDEAHERTLRTDLLIANLKNILRVRNATADSKGKATTARWTPFKVVVMSATLDADKFSHFFDNAKVVYVKGRQHPVTICHTAVSQPDYVDAAVRTVFQIHTDMDPGDILIFLPGQEDIESLEKSLKMYADRLPKGCEGIALYPMYAALPPKQQSKIFAPAPPGTRKCILATNIAETSITIPGIKYVIDTGKCKEKRYVARETGAGFDTLLTRDITKSSAMQRAGRAGREGSGMCFRLYTEESFKTMPDSAEPEIRRCSLTSSLLQLKCLGQDLEQLDFMDKPDQEAIGAALKTLFLLGAIDSQKRLTPLGRDIATFPLEPDLARALIASKEFGCTLEIIDILSVLSASSKLFFDLADEREVASEARQKFRHPSGDHMTTLHVVRSYLEIAVSESKVNRREWCRKQYVNDRCLVEAMDIRSQLRDVCERMQIDWHSSCGADDQAVLKSLVRGLIQHAAFLQPDGSYKQLMGPSVVKVHPSSSLCDKKVPAIIYDELQPVALALLCVACDGASGSASVLIWSNLHELAAMNANHWYPPQSSRYHQQYSSPSTPVARVTSDAVQDGHGLLAVYPFASATPTTHVARHLSNLSISAAAPSYLQAYPPSASVPSYPQAHFPVSGEYAAELNHLASSSVPTYDGGYWESARNDAVRYLGEQEYDYSYYQPSTLWPQSYTSSSAYQTTPFAQSVFQYSSPSTSYPTPPPASISTSFSSLAHALGDPIPKPAKTAHRPNESKKFFDDFLARSSTEMSSSNVTVNPQSTPHRPQAPTKVEESPDPLALPSLSPQRSVRITQTSRKRKVAVALESPTLKRRQVVNGSSSQLFQSQSSKAGRSTLGSSPAKSQGSPTPKKKLEPFIDVPPLPQLYHTPTSRRHSHLESHTPLTNGISRNKGKGRAVEDEDLGGFGTEEDEGPPMSQSSGLGRSVKSSGRRATGERDDRAPIEKFTTLLEDIFEAEDALPADASVGHLPSEFFSPHTIEGAHPHLNSGVIRKLCNYITKVARPSKRLRLSSRESNIGGVTPRSRGGMADLDMTVLSRILKILDRSAKAGQDLDPFGSGILGISNLLEPGRDRGGLKKGGKNNKKSTEGDVKRATSQTPKPAGDVASADDNMRSIDDEQTSMQELADSDLDALTRQLDIAMESVLAADCCIAVLSSDRLPKQLYSEELITVCLNTVKNQLTKIVYPFVEAPNDLHNQPPLLRHVIHPSSRDSNHRRQLAELFQAISSAIPRINDLICTDKHTMSETIIIQAVYIAIGPFFVVEVGGESEGKGKKDNAVLNTLGSSALRGLRLDALALIRNIFANHEEQRGWIIEEILSSLIRLSDNKQRVGQFRLRDGRSIRTVSALLLQLVQTSAHDVRVEARSLRKARDQALAIRRQSSFGDKQGGPFLDEKDLEEIRLYMSGLDSATKAAKTIIIFLTQRSGKSKVTKNANEAEYRAILDSLVSDLLTVLFWPEWPAASLLLSIICKFMVSSLDDVKSTTQGDNNAIKTIALDHLGVIAARLRSATLKFQSDHGDPNKRLKSLDEIMSVVDMTELEGLVYAHQDLAAHLSRRAGEDQAFNSARELTAVIWGQELVFALQQCGGIITESGEHLDAKVDRSMVLPFGQQVKKALRRIWDDSSADVFDVGTSQDEVVRIDRLSEEIGTIQSFKNSFIPILNVVLQSLDAPPVFMRTKALKALGQIVTSDPSILSTHNVRRAIENHLLDSSSAVRDAAVELIGKYMIDSPKFAADYFPKIAERIADTGLGVRKRVIKLLKSYYTVTDDRMRRIDICTRIVLRMLDEDDTVKDLAIKTMEELWFQSALATVLRGRNTAMISDKPQLLSKVTIIMGVAGHFKDRQSPLEDLLHHIMADKEGPDASGLHERYAEICETLIEGLVDATDLPGFTVVNCVRTIHLFTSAYPAVLSGANASTLLPYLKNATSMEEQITSDYLLRIFRASIPYMPKTAAKFGQELQLALQPMIIKPSASAGLLGLQETVACMCAIVQHITHDFGRLVALLRSCNARLQQAISKSSTTMTAPEQRALSILLFIISLLCEHSKFDQIRIEHETLRAEIDSITKGSIIEHVYWSLLSLYNKYGDAGLRGRILQCLGFLFRAQPALMTTDASANIMDAIFASPEEEARGRLLKIMQEFLMSEAAKHAAKEKASAKLKGAIGDVNMDELVGNTDGFAESGVSSAVVQRYLDPIVQAALAPNPQTQAAAVDILSFTIKQGLAHPLQSFPVIVALETSPNSSLSTRASALHSILHSKHTSLLNARYVVSARASFDYQKRLLPGKVQGYRNPAAPTALLQRWYGLVREKRATRQDFLKALVKVFDIELNAQSTQDDVDFIRYMAENFSTFEYKTQEEVLTVLKYLTGVLSTTGMQLVETLSPQHLLTQLHAPSEGNAQEQALAPVVVSPPGDVEERLPLMRTSVVVAMIVLLKAHLKALYGISEEKCAKWVVGKKSAVGDRPATRRNEQPISWDRLPFAAAPLLTSADLDAQRTRFLEIWYEDGLTAEPEDDLT